MCVTVSKDLQVPPGAFRFNRNVQDCRLNAQAAFLRFSVGQRACVRAYVRACVRVHTPPGRSTNISPKSRPYNRPLCTSPSCLVGVSDFIASLPDAECGRHVYGLADDSGRDDSPSGDPWSSGLHSQSTRTCLLLWSPQLIQRVLPRFLVKLASITGGESLPFV